MDPGWGLFNLVLETLILWTGLHRNFKGSTKITSPSQLIGTRFRLQPVDTGWAKTFLSN